MLGVPPVEELLARAVRTLFVYCEKLGEPKAFGATEGRMTRIGSAFNVVGKKVNPARSAAVKAKFLIL